MKLRKNQAGFGLVEVLLIIIVLILIGGVTWYFVQNRNKNNNQSDNDTSSQVQPEPIEVAEYFDLPELGLKIALSQPIDGLYYANLGNGNAGLSTFPLAGIDQQCDANQGAIARVFHFTDPNEQGLGGQTNAQLYPNATNINGTYYYIQVDQGACTENEQGLAILEQVVPILETAKVEKL